MRNPYFNRNKRSFSMTMQRIVFVFIFVMAIFIMAISAAGMVYELVISNEHSWGMPRVNSYDQFSCSNLFIIYVYISHDGYSWYC